MFNSRDFSVLYLEHNGFMEAGRGMCEVVRLEKSQPNAVRFRRLNYRTVPLKGGAFLIY
jgi:hypothetical protein